MSQRLRAKAERAGSHFQRALAQLPMPTPLPPPAAATAAASPAPAQQGMAGGGSGATDAMRGGLAGGAAAAAAATATLVEISVDLCRTQRLLLEGLGGSAGLAEQDGLLRAGIGYLMRLRPLLGGQQQPPPQGSSGDSSGGAAAAAAVSPFCACIGPPCLRQCVHGASIGGGGGGGGGACCLGPADRDERAAGAEGHAAGVGAGAHEQRGR
eukprot:COSAG01_NODE_199_length_22202_cov_23.993668_19_plen_211_part_00